MSILIYIDTNVYMDYFLGRKDRFVPLDEFAAQVFERARSCEFNILISDWVLRELAEHGLMNETILLFSNFRLKGKLIHISADGIDKRQARSEQTHFSDAIHATLAIRHGADCIVTSNLKDFLLFTNRIRCASPRFL